MSTITVLSEKRVLKNDSKKGDPPPRRKQQAMNTAGGSRRQAHYQELFEQETIVRTHVEAIVRVFA